MPELVVFIQFQIRISGSGEDRHFFELGVQLRIISFSQNLTPTDFPTGCPCLKRQKFWYLEIPYLAGQA